MEELRLAAQANYRNSSRELQDLAADFFNSMDSDGDGQVSIDEFTQFLRQQGYSWITADMFSQLDVNNDGALDFLEVVTFYYIVKTRIWCDGCRTLLLGFHFTCVVCFDGDHNTYDLCANCYGGRNFRHDHTLFMDSYVLLRSKRGNSPAMNMNRAVMRPRTDNSSATNAVFRALELAIDAANTFGCSIM